VEKQVNNRFGKKFEISLMKLIVMKLLIASVMIFGFCLNPLLSQHEEDTIYGIVLKPAVEIRDPEFLKNYNRMVYKMKRIYPLARHAKKLFEDYEKDVATLDKKRQIKKYGKTAYEKLMDDFEYIIRDMYVSDGQLLVKLINRETGMTVFDIIKKYRGGVKATYYQSVGFFFDQNIKTEYKPDGEDWLIELVAKEIEAGKHKTHPIQLLTKDQYKEKQARIKQQKKAAKRLSKQNAKDKSKE
jgi:hypothetical protein